MDELMHVSLVCTFLNCSGLPCSGISKKVEELLKSNLLLSTFRIQRKEKAIWCVEVGHQVYNLSCLST